MQFLILFSDGGIGLSFHSKPSPVPEILKQEAED